MSRLPTKENTQKWVRAYLKEMLYCYSQLLNLTEQQKKNLDTNKRPEITSLLKEKDDWIKKIQSHEKKFQTLTASLDLSLIKKDKEISILFAKLSHLIQHLMQLEKESQEVLSEIKEKSKEEVKDIAKSKKTILSYHQGKKIIPRFIDIKK